MVQNELSFNAVCKTNPAFVLPKWTCISITPEFQPQIKFASRLALCKGLQRFFTAINIHYATLHSYISFYVEIQVAEDLDKTKKIVMKKPFRLRLGLEQTPLNIPHGE